jgi:hypothetical protein
MRFLNTWALALAGCVLAAASLAFALAADDPEPESPGARVFLPGIAGDDATFNPGSGPGTVTPSPSATATTIPVGCAGPRTNVKILADGAAGFDRTPQDSTVGLLMIGERPGGVTNTTPRISPDETRVVSVTAYLLGYQRTNGGGIDLAIAMVDGGEAMIASFPGPGCTSDTPIEDRAAMNSARLALQQACGNPPDSGVFKPIGGTAKLTGVPFWGREHTSTLGAASGIELGPVLSFAFNPATSCDANASKTPYPTATPTPVVTEVLVSVIPQVASPGQEVEVKVFTIPAVANKSCSFQIWGPDPVGQVVASGGPSMTTLPTGTISWMVTLPADMALGSYRVQRDCPGLPTAGAARLTIIP